MSAMWLRGLRRGAIAAAACACFATVVSAQWAANGTLVAPSTREQAGVVTAPDGSGGTIVAWVETATSTQRDIYVQRVSGAGVPLWTAGGVPLCTASFDQTDPVIAGDGNGGAIVAWVDRRDPTPRIYAQRAAADGTVAWAANGMTVSATAAAPQLAPDIVSDGSSGAVIVWENVESVSGTDLRVQQLNSAGARLYTADGLGAPVTNHGNYREPRIARDGTGLPIVVWRKVDSSNSVLYAQRVAADFTTPWGSSGREVSHPHVAGNRYYTRASVIAIGLDQTAYVWRDSTLTDPGQIQANALDVSGNRMWGDDPIPVCATTGLQRDPVLVPDGAGGFIVVWADGRGAASDIYAQRVNAAGAAQWTTNGVPVSTLSGPQVAPTMVSDGVGGALVAWADYASGGGGIDIRRLDAAGTLLWPAAVALSGETLPPGAALSLVADGASGAVAAWTGAGSGSLPNARAQRVLSGGAVLPRFITASAGPNGSISPSGSVAVSSGASQLFTMMPAPFYRVANILVDGGSVGAQATYTFQSVTSDHTIQVTFEPDPLQITASAGPNGTISPSGVTQYSPLANATYTMTPASGYGVLDVLVDGVSVGAVPSYAFTGISASHTIAVTFAPGWNVNGRLISPSSLAQSSAVTASDGAGGTIVAWMDSSAASGRDIRLQRVTAAGVPVWGSNGVTLCSAPGDQDDPAIAGDGAGGAIVAWVDRRAGQPRIYAQRVRANGVAAWAADGITASAAATFAQLNPDVAADGNLGAFIAWEYVTGGSTADLIVQQIDSTGTGTYAGNGGLGATVTVTGDSREPRVVRDDGGLPVIAWTDMGAVPTKVWTMRMRADWIPQWGPKALGNAAANQGQVQVVSLGTAGTAYAWREVSGSEPGAIRANRIDLSGGQHWGGASGLLVCGATGAQRDPVLTTDGAGGAIVAWGDARTGTSDVYAQRIESGGGAIAWVVDGVAVTTAAGSQLRPSIVADGGGGAVIMWADTTGGVGAVSVQRLNSAGALQWSSSGVPLYQGAQPGVLAPVSVQDGVGGVVAVWAGAGAGAEANLRAQRVRSDGVVVPRTITATAGTGGSISPPGPVLLSIGASQTFTITPDTYQHVVSILVDGTPVQIAPTYTFSNVTADHTIHVTFASDEFTIMATAGPNGSISPSGVVTVQPLADVTFNITPAAGYAIQSVTVDDTTRGAISTYTFRGVTTTHKIAATFAPTWTVGGRIVAPSAFAQSTPVATSVGAGGTIVAWVDSRAGSNTDIYVQLVSNSGVSQWTSGGVPLCTAAGIQDDPAIAADGTGGAIVAWVDRRDGVARIYAQRVLATGDTAWAANGITASASSSAAQLEPDVASDGAQGAFVVWEYYSSGGKANLRIQQLNSSGARGYTGSSGLGATVTTAGDARNPRVVRDSGNLPVIVWTDANSSSNNGRIQRMQQLLNPTNWQPDWNRSVASSSGGYQAQLRVARIGSSSTICVWRDSTSTNPGDIRARIISSGGGLNGTTPANAGIQVCVSALKQKDPVVETDGTTGAFIAWGDARADVSDIYAQRLDTSGIASWTVNGVAVVAQTGTQSSPAMTADGAGGVIVAWKYDATGVTGVAAQNLNSSGVPQWSAVAPLYTGALTSGAGLVLVTDNAAGAVAAWEGTGSGAQPNIRAQRALADGVVVAHTITVTTGPNGAITPPGPLQVSEGTSPTFTITPNTYYHVEDVVVDGASVGAVTQRTFPNVSADHSIHATFAPNVYTITASAGPNGTISPAGAVSVNALTSLAFTIAPAYGYVVQDVLVSGVSLGPRTSYTFTNVKADSTIAATFIRSTWPSDGLVVAMADKDRIGLEAISDGAGGTIFAWGDSRASARGVYVQHVGPDATLDWTPNGTRVVATSDWSNSNDLVLVSDGAGGALVACVGNSVGGGIEVRRISTAGQVLWSTSTTLTSMNQLQAVPDGTGGLWLGGGSQVQHVDATGDTSPPLVLPGLLLSDGSGGFFAAWGVSYNGIFVQRFTGTGSPIWPARRLTTTSGIQTVAGVTSDGAGGLIVLWFDDTSQTLMAGRVDPDGLPLWPFDGVQVTSGPEAEPAGETNGLYQLRLASDGAHGLVVTYHSTHNRVVAQRVSVNGEYVWSSEGKVLSSHPANVAPDLVPDGGGGGIVFWVDSNGGGDILGQHVDGNGNFVWSDSVIAVGGNAANTPAAAPDGASGAVIGWLEKPSVGGAGFNCYARRILFAGQFGSPAHRITASATSFGTISPSGTVGLMPGSNLTFTINPDPSCRTVDVLVNGVSKGAVATYAFTNIQGDSTIEASFAQNLYTVTASSSPGGIISPSGTESILQHESRSYLALPNDGFRVSDFVVDGMSLGAISSYMLADITAPHTISVVFARDITTDGAGWTAAGRVVALNNLGQTGATQVPDGSGGTIAVWVQTASQIGSQLLAQRFDAGGRPLWTSGGVALTAQGKIFSDVPGSSSDGQGGLAVAWLEKNDSRQSTARFQRVTAAGSLVHAPGGLLLASDVNQATRPMVQSLEAGDAFVVWSKDNGQRFYRVAVSSSGGLTGGSPGSHEQTGANVAIAFGGNHSVFIAWEDPHPGSEGGAVRIARVRNNASGGLGSTATSAVGAPTLIAAPDSSVILSWVDSRNDNPHIFAQRMLSSFTEVWGSGGVAVSTAANRQGDISMAPDGEGGALISWVDSRAGVNTADIYAQRLNLFGEVKWTTDGVPVCTAAGPQRLVSIDRDGAGGAYLAWRDARGADTTDTDVYVQRLDASGAALWPTNGVRLGNSAGDADAPSITLSPAGSATAIWQNDEKVLVQRISSAGRQGFDHTVFTSTTPNGAISPPGNVGVFSTSSQPFTITAAPNWRVRDVLINGYSEPGPPTSIQLNGIVQDQTIQVIIAPAALAGDTTSHLVARFDFQDPDGTCQTRDWAGTDLASEVFAHVSDRFVVNSGDIVMGNHALWVGADSTTAPQETRQWVYGTGFGNNWSQRVISPEFTFDASAVFRFDATLDLADTGGLTSGDLGNEFLGVQALHPDGHWVFLTTHFTPNGGATFTGTRVAGKGVFSAQTLLGADGNDGLGLTGTTRLRVVVQTDSAGSSEDGGVGPRGAAVIDNLSLSGTGITTSTVDFENGTIGNGWSLAAQNGAILTPGLNPSITRDTAPPGTAVTLKTGFDTADLSCAWTFVSADSTLRPGAYAKLTSPWLPLADREDDWALGFAGRFHTLDERRVVRVLVRGKDVGNTRPRFVSRLGTWVRNAVQGGDLAAPFDTLREYRYQGEFINPQPADSIQLVFFVEDRAELDPAGFANRPPTRLPVLDRIYVTQLAADQDGDGVADNFDDCPNSSAIGQDADGDGCIDPTATFRHVETWEADRLPIKYTISQSGVPGITDGSGVQAIRQAFATWAAVNGAAIPFEELPFSAQTTASAIDGVNLITFQDTEFEFPYGVIAIAPTTSFTRRASFGDRVVQPGQIVDSDVIFNPEFAFETPTQPSADGFDLQSVATHEIGHLLGLTHSPVETATMFPVLQPDTLAASLTADDRSAIAAAYPSGTLSSQFGTVLGSVRYMGTMAPVPGAAVYAVRLGPGDVPADTACSDFTREDGAYALRRLDPGRYWIRVAPLDGRVPGLEPGAISARVAAIARIDFEAEWWSVPEDQADTTNAHTAVEVPAAMVQSGIDILVNPDAKAPVVLAVLPAADSISIHTDTAIRLDFSEPVNIDSLAAAIFVRPGGAGRRIAGRLQPMNRGQSVVFVPALPLLADTTYEIRITTRLTDRNGVRLEAPVVSTFETEPISQAVVLSSVSPSVVPAGGLVTVSGEGFDPADPASHQVFFTRACEPCAPESVQALVVNPRSLTVAVPSTAVTGNVYVKVDGNPSNSLLLTVTTAPSIVPPTPVGTPVVLHGPPSDVAITPNGSLGLAVGRHGFEIVSIDPQGQAGAAVEYPLVGPAHQVVVSLDGSRAFATQPQLKQVVLVDLIHTPGHVDLAIPIDGVPEAIALSPDGRRAVVTDAAAPLLHLLDVDAGSVTQGAVLDTFQIPFPGISRGVAFEPSGRFVLVGREGAGLVALDLPTRLWQVVNTETPSGGVASHPDGRLLMAAGESGLLTAQGDPAQAVLQPGASIFANALRDVAVTPSGRCAVVVSSALNRVAMVDLNGASATYGTEVASAPTGGEAPIAVALSADGTRGLIANAGDDRLTVFNFGGATAFSAVVPDAGVPGDLIAALGSGNALTTETKVDVANGSVDADHTVGSAVAFRVPDRDPAATTVSLAAANGQRSLSLPFSILPAPGAFVPSLTSFQVIPSQNDCPGQIDFRSVQRLSVSPDGRWVAALENAATVGGCTLPAAVSLFEASDRGNEPIGAPRWSDTLTSTPKSLAFDATGSRLWVATHDGFTGQVEVLDTDPSSLQRRVATLPSASVGLIDEIAADPLGRYVYLASASNQSITVATPAGVVANTVSLTGLAPVAMAASRDGRYLVVASFDRLRFIETATWGVAFSTPPLPGFSPTRLAVPSAGHCVVAHDGQHRLGIWDLDQGALGAQLFLGAAFAPGEALLGLTPAPLGTGVIASLAGSDSLYLIDTAPATPVITRMQVLTRARWIERSADGRRLWAVSAATPSPPAAADTIHTLALEGATQLVLVAGGGQAALAGTALANPVRVKVTNAGHPVPGMVVRFQASNGSSGGIDDAAPGDSVIRLTNVKGEVAVSWTVPVSLGDVTLTVRVLGSSTAPLEVTATSVADDAVAGPAVISTAPSNEANGIDPATRMLVRFSQRMDSTSVASRFTLQAAGSPVSGKFHVEDGGRAMLFRPDQPLPFGTSCIMTIAAGATDREGQPLASTLSVAFTTAPEPPLAIQAITPRAANGKVPVVISGRGFSRVASQNVVLFSGRPATVRTAADDALVVQVPEEAVSGDVWVVVNGAPTNRLYFQRLHNDALTPVIYGVAETGGGSRSAAVSPDGSLVYVTQHELNAVEVVRVSDLRVTTVIPVGEKPIALAVLASHDRLYVLNKRSRTVSVVDIKPGSPDYHKVIETIDVGGNPRDIAASPFGPRVFIASGGEVGGIQILERKPGATHHEVVKTVPTGSGTTGVAVATDGGHLVVTTGEGVKIVDIGPLSSGQDPVVKTVPTGSGTTGVAVSTDGGLALILGGSGQVLVVSLRPGKDQYSILDTLEVDESTKGLAFTPDGGHVLLAVQDQGSVHFVRIEVSFSEGDGTSEPAGPALSLTEQDVGIGEAPAGIAVDPFGGFALVTDEAKGRMTLLGLESSRPLDGQFRLDLEKVALGSGFPWVKGSVELPLPETPDDIVLGSVRVAGTVPADATRGTTVEDVDLDGRSELVMSFRRDALDALLPVGAAIVATCTGQSHERAFQGPDTLAVRRGAIISPAAMSTVAPGQPFTVQYSTSADPGATSIRLLQSLDRGRTWSLVVASAPNTGSVAWTPNVVADSAMLAVVQVDGVLGDSLVSGVVGMSGVFRIGATTDVPELPVVLEFSPLRPNPARDEIVMRFGLPNRTYARLEVFDLQGRRIVSLIDGVLPPGWHTANWDGRIGHHQRGGRAGAGVYFVRFTAEGRTFHQRLVWLN